MIDPKTGKIGTYVALVMVVSLVIAVVGVILGNFMLAVEWLCVTSISYYFVMMNIDSIIWYCEETSRELQARIDELERRKKELSSKGGEDDEE